VTHYPDDPDRGGERDKPRHRRPDETTEPVQEPTPDQGVGTPAPGNGDTDDDGTADDA
jgi:hypothetical protein